MKVGGILTCFLVSQTHRSDESLVFDRPRSISRSMPRETRDVRYRLVKSGPTSMLIRYCFAVDVEVEDTYQMWAW